MRLATLVLTALGPLAAQVPSHLPWQLVQPLPWQPVLRASGDTGAGAPPAPSSGSLQVQVSPDGTLRVVDAQGVIRLLTGLPGRPLRAWRDGGVPLAVADGSWRFPARTPLAKGLGALQWCAEDFRPFLDGLLWILGDGETILAVVHPATGRIIYLPLPPGQDFALRFLPDRLEVTARQPDPGGASRWFLPWMAFLPRLAALGPKPDTAPKGTALVPFPQD